MLLIAGTFKRISEILTEVRVGKSCKKVDEEKFKPCDIKFPIWIQARLSERLRLSVKLQNSRHGKTQDCQECETVQWP